MNKIKKKLFPYVNFIRTVLNSQVTTHLDKLEHASSFALIIKFDSIPKQSLKGHNVRYSHVHILRSILYY
jgi:hypothetical protein